MTKTIGVITAGGDTPGLNSALRALGKTASGRYGMHEWAFVMASAASWKTAPCASRERRSAG